MKKVRKIAAVLMVLCMVLSLLPVGTLATEDAPELVDGYYEIYTADQLYWFATQVNIGNNTINAKLMADIVVNETVLTADGELVDGGSGLKIWSPIGKYKSWYNATYYKGTFDGQGHTISGLYVNDSSKSYVGLFALLGSSGKVQNVGIVNSYFKGDEYVGGLIGYSPSGKISNCYSAATVWGKDNVGGLVGYNGHWMEGCYATGRVYGTGSSGANGGLVGLNTGNIHSSYNTASITGNDYVGGIAGANEGQIVDCSNMGAVSGNSYPAGGIAGWNARLLDTCYNDGSVSGQSFVGGLAGKNVSSILNGYNAGEVSANSKDGQAGGIAGGNTEEIENCLNLGQIHGDSTYIGGVVGTNEEGSITSCFYLDSCVAATNSYASPATAEALASGEIAYLLQGQQEDQVWGQKIGTDPYPSQGGVIVYKNEEVYSNTCVHVWTEVSCVAPKTCEKCGATEGEKLDCLYDNGFCTVCGGYQVPVRNGEVFEIYNAGQLYSFVSNVLSEEYYYAEFRLMADITVNENVLTDDGKLNGNGSSFRDWTPPIEFAGVFDGSGKTISGLYGYEDGVYYNGLFANLDEGAVVKNVGVIDSYFSCYSYVGGIVAYNWGTVEQCYFDGVIEGSSCVGGIVGLNDDGIVNNCYNLGSVTGYEETWMDRSNEDIGGVVGYNSGLLSNCYNFGTVQGGTNVGAVAGYNNSADEIINCYYLTGCAIDENGQAQQGIGHDEEEEPCTDVTGSTAAKTAKEMASGEVAYLLQGEQSEQIWGQTIGVDPYPMLSENKVYCITDGETVFGYSNVEGQLPVLGVTVSGNVTSYLDGDATVELVQDGEVVYSTTVSGGSYVFEGVAAGEYTLRITKDNHAPMEFAITVGDEAVTQDAIVSPVGDVTGDGVVNIKDFQRLLRHVNKTNPLTDYELACGDVTGDGVCNIKDFQRLLRHVNKTNPLF